MATKKTTPSWSNVKTSLMDFDALVRMFEQALKTTASLAEVQRLPLWERLRAVHQICRNFGYGVSDDMGDLLAEYGTDD